MTLSYGVDRSRIANWKEAERFRDELESARTEMVRVFGDAERLWEKCEKDVDDHRIISTAVLIASVTFLDRVGIPEFALKRLRQLMFSLGEANAGHNTPLLSRAKIHPGYFSQIDLMYQGAAQTCVDLLTGARIAVAEARRRIARLFALKEIKGFSVPTLNKLGARLSGRGAKEDRAYDYYQMANAFAEAQIAARGGAKPISEELAWVVAKAVIEKAVSTDVVHKRYSA